MSLGAFLMLIGFLFLNAINLQAETKSYQINYDLNKDGHISTAIVGSVMYVKGDELAGIDHAPKGAYDGIKELHIENGVTDIAFSAFENTSIKKVFIEPFINPNMYFFAGSQVEELYLSLNYEEVNDDIREDGSDSSYIAYIGSNSDYGSDTLKVFHANSVFNPKGTVYAAEVNDVLYIVGSGVVGRSRNLPYTPYTTKEIRIGEGITGIGKEAFQNYFTVEKIHISSTVTSIGNQAFADTKLKEITIPKTVKTIGSNNFGSRYLKKVVIENGVKHVDGFQGCRVPRITLPSSVETLGKYAFNCSYTKYIEIPGSVKIIPKEAFACCKIETVVLHEGIEVLGKGAFTDCVHIKHIKLPRSLKSIGRGCFSCCNKLEELTIPGNVKVLDSGVLDSCYNIKELVFCEGVEEIKNKICDQCENLETLVLPSTLKKIGKDCFKDCNKLKYVTIPENVKSIADYAFGFTTNVKANTFSIENNTIDTENNEILGAKAKSYGGRYKLPGFVIAGKSGTAAQKYAKKYGFKFISEPNYKKKFTQKNLKYVISDRKQARCCGSTKKMSSVKIPDTVKLKKRTYKVVGISNNAFKNNRKLSKITLGKNLSYIGEKAFYNCSRLKRVTIKSKKIKKTTVKRNAFKGTKKTIKIIVPKKKKSSYKKILFEKGINKKARFVGKFR